MSTPFPVNRLWLSGCLPVLLGCMCAGLLQADDAISQAKSLSRSFRQAAENVKPGVVTIISTRRVQIPDRGNLRELLRDPRFNFPFEIPEEADDGENRSERTQQDIGSGVIIDTAGIVLTNNHVVDGADEVVIRLADGSEHQVNEIKQDVLSDLAILQFAPESTLSAVPLGDSQGLEIGDWVIAIGSPFDLEATVSAGIISAKGRSIPRIKRAQLIQTDAAINPGNSGGPLVNLDGEVVGINTAIATSSGGYQGVGFAIPVNKAKWVVSELQSFGEVRRAWLGIEIGELTATAARELNLPARSGVWVETVGANTPAAAAKLEAGDVIVSFAGAPMRAPGDLQAAVERQEIGTQQAIEVVRDGERIRLTVTVEAYRDQL